MPRGKTELQMVTHKEGQRRFAVKPSQAKQSWLRMEVSEGKVVTQFRESQKDHWTTVGQSLLPSAGKAKVGVMAGGAPKDAERFVSFKEFRILQLPK